MRDENRSTFVSTLTLLPSNEMITRHLHQYRCRCRGDVARQQHWHRCRCKCRVIKGLSMQLLSDITTTISIQIQNDYHLSSSFSLFITVTRDP